ncbi:MAG: ATP-binding protein [Acidobacteriota bacterium]
MKKPGFVGSLILGMLAVSIGGMTVGVFALYQTSFTQAEQRLTETVTSWSELMGAMARFDRQYSANSIQGGARAATMQQIREAHETFQGYEELEFTLARREGDQIIFELNQRQQENETIPPLAFDSQLAEPMREALLGRSGVLVGLDYRGTQVLAAYEPVPELAMGVVAKIELSELRAPFVRTGLVVFVINLGLILAGIRLFQHIGNPVVDELQQSQQKLKAYADDLEDRVEERTQELQRAQREIVRQEKLAVLGKMSGSVGHELRNPLGVISNAVYYLQSILTDPDEKVREYLGIISSEVERAGRIISDLMNLTRLKSPVRDEVAVGDLLDRALEQQPEHGSLGISITREIASGLTPVHVDSGQIEQVLVNLLANARQAMPEGGQLTIEAEAEESAVRLSLTDTGCGISRKNIEHIFEPLFTTKARGIGFGLSIAKSLMEQNGGSLQVESRQGEGSTFTMILPNQGDVS